MGDNEIDVYLGEVRLGDRVREFALSDVGQYLLGRAQIEMDEAKAAMVRINPYWPRSKTKLAKLQQDYRTAENFARWLNDALQNGDIALEQIRALQEDD